MNKAKLAVATICWARDAAEAELLIQALTRLSTFNVPVFICDGGSPQSFLSIIQTLPNITLLQPDEKGLWPQAKTSLLAAASTGAPFILYSEPDKNEFFAKHLQSFIDDAPQDEAVGIFLAERTPETFCTFPTFQQQTETAINTCATEVTGSQHEFTYGPFILNTTLVQHASQLPASIGWGWRSCMFGLAARLGLTINGKAGAYNCPDSQVVETAKDRMYRIRQLQENVEGLLLSTKINL